MDLPRQRERLAVRNESARTDQGGRRATIAGQRPRRDKPKINLRVRFSLKVNDLTRVIGGITGPRVVDSGQNATHKKPMTKRERNLVVKCTDAELNMLHRMSDDGDEPIARIVRRLVTAAYVARYGVETPPAAKLKHEPKG